MKTILVSKTPPGDFKTIQEAVNSVPDNSSETYRIHIKPGVYKEKIFIRKNNLEIYGEDPSETIIEYGDGARKLRDDGKTEYGTFNSAVVLFAGSNITVKNITIENTAGPGNIAGQALAAYVAADRCSFYNCRFLGYQDTIFAGECTDSAMKNLMLPDFFTSSKVNIEHQIIRNYFKDCYVAGDVDFIFGPNCCYFEGCEIYSRKRESEACSYITAASTPASQEYGLVFHNCKLTSDDQKGSVYLGRPWRNYAKTAFISCNMAQHIHPHGWHNWGRTSAEALCGYVEYGCYGDGASTLERALFSKQLTNPEVEEYFSISRVFASPDEWIPDQYQ